MARHVGLLACSCSWSAFATDRGGTVLVATERLARTMLAQGEFLREELSIVREELRDEVRASGLPIPR